MLRWGKLVGSGLGKRELGLRGLLDVYDICLFVFGLGEEFFEVHFGVIKC